MREIIQYLLETFACSGVLYGAYALLLKNRTGYLAARLYLVGSTLLAALIPLLSIPVWPGQIVVATAGMPTAIVVTDMPAPISIDPKIIIWIVYGCGVFLQLLTMLRQAARIRHLKKNSPTEKVNGIMLARPSEPISSFSFFRTIYISCTVSEKDVPVIIAHEKSHIAHHHSLERIVMECLKTLLWWNPFAWLATHSLTEVEEFEADHDVVNEGYDVGTYIETIFTQLFGFSPDIANSLRNSLTKKRLQMMTTPKKSRYALLRLAATLPCIAALVTAFSFTAKATEIRPAQTVSPATSFANPVSIAPTSIAPVSADLGNRPIVDKPHSPFSSDSLKGTQDRLEAVQPSTTKSETQSDGELLLVLNGEVTDFSTDPATGERAFSATGNVTHRIIPESEFTPEIRAKYGKYLEGKSAIAFFETQENSDQSVEKSEESKPEILSQTPVQEEEAPTAPEVMPKFRDGDLTTFSRWVNNRIRYPEEAFKNNIQGKVVAQFIVTPDGKVSDITILRSPAQLLSDEVIRVLKSSPQWTPGRNRDGETVTVSFIIPVEFWTPDNSSSKK